jgi:hypothetical protein
MVITQRAGILGTLMLGLVLSGCSLFSPEDAPEPEPEPPAEFKPRTSPENVLFNLALAHERRLIDAYRDQMDPDYVFVPSPNDPDVTFTELAYNEDQESTENMFDVVDQIDLTLTHPAPIPSDFEGYPGEEGYRLIQVTSVNMRVVTREIIDGEPLILLVGGDPAKFIFKPDSTQTPVTWRIVYQQDDS